MTNETKKTTGAEIMRKIYEGKTIVNANNQIVTDWTMRQFNENAVFNYRLLSPHTIQIWRVPSFIQLLKRK